MVADAPMHQTSTQTVRTARSFRIEVTSLHKPLTRNGLKAATGFARPPKWCSQVESQSVRRCKISITLPSFRTGAHVRIPSKVARCCVEWCHVDGPGNKSGEIREQNRPVPGVGSAGGGAPAGLVRGARRLLCRVGDGFQARHRQAESRIASGRSPARCFAAVPVNSVLCGMAWHRLDAGEKYIHNRSAGRQPIHELAGIGARRSKW
jgi:hypothetical protein